MTASRHDKRILGGGIALATAGFALPMLDADLDLALYLIATSLLTCELFDIAVRYWVGSASAPWQPRGGLVESSRATGAAACLDEVASPFALVMSVRNFKAEAPRVLKPLAPYKAHLWIIDDGSNDDTAAYLEFLGWRCFKADTNRKKPGAIKALLERLPAEIRTVLVLDPDCEPLSSGRFGVSDLEHAVRKFQRSGAAACCPRVRVHDEGGFTSFQLLEVELAFLLGRKSLSPFCITAGVSLYDREALERALDEHSLSVYAEDLENTLIILKRGQAILYEDDLVLVTTGKRTIRGWFSQRVGWSFGLIRVFTHRWRNVLTVARLSPWCSYNFVIYLGVLGIASFPVKVAGTFLFAAGFANACDTFLGFDLLPDNAATDPRYFAATYAPYALLCTSFYAYAQPAMRLSTALTAVVFYPFYAVAHTLAMAVGYLNWFSYCTIGRRFYRDHYEGQMGLEGKPLFAAAPDAGAVP